MTFTDRVASQALKRLQKTSKRFKEKLFKGAQKPYMNLAHPFKGPSTSLSEHGELLRGVPWLQQGFSSAMAVEATPGRSANIEASGWPVVNEESQQLHP